MKKSVLMVVAVAGLAALAPKALHADEPSALESFADDGLMAQRLDLISRELRKLRAKADGPNLRMSDGALMAIAQDPDRPERDRLEALRSLRTDAVKNSEVLNFLREGAARLETPALRRRAIQSLGLALSLKTDDAAAAALEEIAEGAEESDLSVRQMALMALHWVTHGNEGVRGWMADWTGEERPKVLRRAALWALQSSCDVDDGVRSLLVSTFQNRKEDMLTRVTALRSLYPVAGGEEVRAAALDAARDPSEDKDVRYAAILFLGTVADRSLVRPDLEAFAGESNEYLREAALRALRDGNGPEMRQMHRARFDPVIHIMIEVLELE